MARTVAIGIQDFEKIREKNVFYIDKTDFIREWWENGDDVTLITRPRRFGKTLNMSMVEHFFSVDYANRGDLFDGLSIWQDEKYRNIPIIVTSQGGEKSVEKSFDLGATDFVEKPYNLRIILHRVQNAVMAFRNAKKIRESVDKKNVLV